MDHLKLGEAKARLGHARAEYTKALTAEREAGGPHSKGLGQASVYRVRSGAFINVHRWEQEVHDA
jgi:hypothetical protein